MTNDAKARSDRINKPKCSTASTKNSSWKIHDDRLARLLNEASEHPEPGNA